MRRWALFSVLFFVSALLLANLPYNLTTIKQQLTQYHDSGQYQQDIRDVTGRATGDLRYRVQQNNKLTHPKKLAVVFDIDETLLSNYRKMKASHFGQGGPISNDDPAIAPTVSLYNQAKQSGVTVFLITGRRDSVYHRQLTIENLHKVSLNGWQTLFLKPAGYKLASAIPYKSSVRQKIVQLGYDIVFSIGDQMSDLKGGHADNTFKLPNPFYFIA